MQSRVQVIRGDITDLNVDVIVNSANETLLGGGGVDGAIHQKAGPKLFKECRAHGGCATGDAKVTFGYELNARHVIHAVGPVWFGGNMDEEKNLEKCYLRCLELAVEKKAETIAFPATSTGAYGFPLILATKIAFFAVCTGLFGKDQLKLVIFSCFNDLVEEIYLETLKIFRGSDEFKLFN